MISVDVLNGTRTGDHITRYRSTSVFSIKAF